MPLVQTEQNIPLSPATWWRRYNHFSHCYGFRKLLWWTVCKNTSQKMVLHHHQKRSSLGWELRVRHIVYSVNQPLQLHPWHHTVEHHFFPCLLIYYQNFCADAARICSEFHCMYTPYICNFITLLDRKKSVHLEENSTCSHEDPTDSMSPPISIYVFIWIINTLKAHCKPSTPFGRRVSTKWSKANCTDKMLNFSLRRFTCSTN